MRCTAIMLNWDRPENVSRITEGWMQSPFIQKGVVFSNKPGLPELPPIAVGISSTEDLGLTTRFMAGLLAETDVVFIQDDDLIVHDEALKALLEYHAADPEILHGIFGRRPKGDGSYARLVDKVEAEVEVVLTRALVCQKQHCVDFFVHLKDFPILRSGNPKGNGEDIVFSFVTMANSGRLNRVHKLNVTELDSRSAIHHRPGHIARRSTVMRHCVSWLTNQRRRDHVWFGQK